MSAYRLRVETVMADGGREIEIDVAAVREHVDYWIRARCATGGRAIHLPSDESTRDEPDTPCPHEARDRYWRTFDPDHFPDWLLEQKLCRDCLEAHGFVVGSEETPDYGRSPADVLAEAGLSDLQEDERDEEIATDGGEDLSEVPTHDLIKRALEEADDARGDGVKRRDVIDWIKARTELESRDILDTMEFLEQKGEIYSPADDYYRRTEAEVIR